MSEVTRAGWFDNARNQAVTEQIVKEDRYRNAAMATDFAAELAELEAEEKAKEEAIAAESVSYTHLTLPTKRIV